MINLIGAPQDWDGTPFFRDESVERNVFQFGHRILGTERVCRRVWQGKDAGYTWSSRMICTAEFPDWTTAAAWRSWPYRAFHLLQVAERLSQLPDGGPIRASKSPDFSAYEVLAR